MDDPKPLRFVAVDDSPIVRGRLVAYLRSGGYDVVAEAANGRDAVDLCEKHRPDAVVLDISMPYMTGDEAARKIIAAGTVRYVFMATSMGADSVVKPLLKIGALWVSKPYHREKLLQDIPRLIAEADAR